MAAGGRRFSFDLNAHEKRTLSFTFGVVLLLHVIGWGIILALVVPRHYHFLGIGIALTAYTLGMRHAFDADHISAIDNTTRKFMREGKRPMKVGLYFSLGHSTVVFLLGGILIFAAKGLFHQVASQNSTLHAFGGLVGTIVSGSFLYLIALINLAVLVGIVRSYKGLRSGNYDEDALSAVLNKRGLFSRVFSKLLGAIKKEGHMYPVGFLFGLGFDTATEVALLAFTAGAASTGLPFYAILALPILFAAGMTLFDTLDGTFMNFAYGWAFSSAARKIFYNFTITGLSIMVAFFIGTVELGAILANELRLSGGVWNFVSNFNINKAGMYLVALFVVTWAIAVAVWKLGRFEERLPAPAPALAESSEHSA